MATTSVLDNSTSDYFYVPVDYVVLLQCDSENVAQFQKVFLPCVYYIVCIIGIAENILVVTCVIYDKCKNLIDIHMMSLAIADILFLGTLPFWAYIASHEWTFGIPLCKLIHSLYSVSLYSCMLTITYITIDRYITISQAVRARLYQSQRWLTAKVICICIWVFSVALSIPQMLFSEVVTASKRTCQMKHLNNNDISLLTARMSQMLIGFLIPFLAMVICYYLIIRTLIHSKGFSKQKSIRLIFATVMSFIVFQLPYNVMIFINAFKSDEDLFLQDCSTKIIHKYARVVTEALASLRCCLSPILYAFLGATMRSKFIELLKQYRIINKEQLSQSCKTERETFKTVSVFSSIDGESKHVFMEITTL
ncbi:C-C chemokine receptor type 7-like [Protopterus annectens]|uniref:C-C chemokine receptor type 7-like n=1 Tax=Protopterus annectens TaxID=7888 RepID=UPI001CFB0716|nr:C-C chemokine receptor type 7-like [Protopterus annectens]XP_043920808.1 C-C chemokine receptor type 7-like [Protopterus annectens]